MSSRRPALIYCKNTHGTVSFLNGPPTIQTSPPNQILGTPSFGSQDGPLKPTPTDLGLDVPNLQILRIGDIPGMSTNRIMQFHNVDPKLVHRLSRIKQYWPRGVIFVNNNPTLEFDYPLSFKETALTTYRTKKLKHCFCLRPIPIAPTKRENSTHKTRKTYIAKRGEAQTSYYISAV